MWEGSQEEREPGRDHRGPWNIVTVWSCQRKLGWKCTLVTQLSTQGNQGHHQGGDYSKESVIRKGAGLRQPSGKLPEVGKPRGDGAGGGQRGPQGLKLMREK